MFRQAAQAYAAQQLLQRPLILLKHKLQLVEPVGIQRAEGSLHKTSEGTCQQRANRCDCRVCAYPARPHTLLLSWEAAALSAASCRSCSNSELCS